MEQNHSNNLKVKSIGIDTYRENTIYMRHDCHICLSEGLKALTRLGFKTQGSGYHCQLQRNSQFRTVASLILIQFAKSLNLIKP